ncbi:hypothetical protein LCGC14_0990760 [marine sediment metagenome]|uniref:Uncharacterized protein n=1 Tax=marine sediment metagenome TaxID=412755 RepID=A0A0F9NSF1_9ZZZZ|nr:hypothetical protein [archaeon]
MKKIKKVLFIIISLILIPLIFSTLIILTKAEADIPSNFNQDLDLDEIYIYRIAAFNTSKHLEWADLDWAAPTKGYVNVTPGGLLKINFTGFYNKDPNDFFNLFESPIPYMEIEFVMNRSGILITNTTLYNISNGEAAQDLLIGYNKFKSGFLIPTNNFNNLIEQANAQDEPPYMNATVLIQETSRTLSFEFQQKAFFQQKTFCTYDKLTGLLIYTNTTVGNYFLEMTLTNLPDYTSDSNLIPSFQLSLIITALFTTSIIYIFVVKRKIKAN